MPSRAAGLTIALTLLIVALTALQYRWLNQLGTLARASMERNLRVAVQQVAGEVDHDLRAILIELARNQGPPGADTLHRAVLSLDSTGQRLRARFGSARDDSGSALRFRVPASGGPGRVTHLQIALGQVWLTDSLLPALRSRVSALAEVNASVALVRDSAGSAAISIPALPGVGSADASADIMVPLTSPEQIFLVGSNTAITRPDSVLDMTWTPAPGGIAPHAVRWRLVARHPAGSLEAAATQLRRRNMAIGFGMIGLLIGTGGLLLHATRRQASDAMERTAMLAGVSHELRTPLAVIRSAADNLRAGVVDSPDSVAEYGELVMQQTHRLGRAVDHATQVSRLLGGRRALSPAVTSLTDTIDRVVEQLEDRERITTAITADATISTDPAAFECIVRNLVENALAYSPAHASVEITAARSGEAVMLQIADRGPGIGKDARRWIFSPFARGPSAERSHHAGLGLGLTLVSHLVKRLGGRIVVQARPGGGSIFTVTLPDLA